MVPERAANRQPGEGSATGTATPYNDRMAPSPWGTPFQFPGDEWTEEELVEQRKGPRKRKPKGFPVFVYLAVLVIALIILAMYLHGTLARVFRP